MIHNDGVMDARIKALVDYAMHRTVSERIATLFEEQPRVEASLLILRVLGWLRGWSRPEAGRERLLARSSASETVTMIELLGLGNLLRCVDGRLEFAESVSAAERDSVVRQVSETYHPPMRVTWLHELPKGYRPLD